MPTNDKGKPLVSFNIDKLDKATINDGTNTTTFAVDKDNGTITAETKNSSDALEEKRIYLPQSFSFAVAKLGIATSGNTPSVESKGDSDSKNTTIPSAGTAFYKGIAVGFKDDKSDFDVGKLVLEVNFQEKRVKAREDAITRTTDAIKIKFEEGDITDGSYTGTDKAKATVNSQEKTGSYSGQFFGKNAAETAGKVEFNDAADKFLSTAFIGKKETK